MVENFKNLKIFKDIEEGVVEKILTTCKRKNYKSGDIILKQGDPTNGEGYIIKSGEVEVEIDGTKVSTLKEGDIFGEIALLNEEERIATVTAKTDIQTIVLTQNDILDMVYSGNTSISKDIMNRIEENISNNLFKID